MTSRELRLNAGLDPADAGLGPVRGEAMSPARWALRTGKPARKQFLAPRLSDPRAWRDKDVGWGLVVRDGSVIPPSLAALVAARGGAPVFHYMPGSSLEYICLRNLAAGRDVAIEGSPPGVAPDALPTYLTIWGTPDEVPWRLQYVLNTTRCVGRLPLAGTALDNYVNALLRWDRGEELGVASDAAQGEVLIWSTNQGDGDITELMRDAIARPLAAAMRSDAQLSTRVLEDAEATAAGLRDALGARRVGLVVTTSHGRTGPLGDPAKMKATLGHPVSSDGTLVSPELLSSWQPGGAVWYAHACCSAGSDGTSNFTGLFAEGSPAGAVLSAVAGLGSTVATLPVALLGAERPLRAFVGHVEPTFDWTLALPYTGQHLTAGLVDALYTRMFVAGSGERALPPAPVGFALRAWFGRVAGLDSQRRQAELSYGKTGRDAEDILLATALAARDLESTVILGDPTVAIPALG